VSVAIINCGMGNIRSVANAFEALGCRARVCELPEDLKLAELIILPGVGAFPDAMNNLRQGGWLEVLQEKVIFEKTAFLGICLGMQILATTGTEHGLCPGLNWIPGRVERLQTLDPALRIPHIGWNDVRFSQKAEIYDGLGESQCFYFLHSYVFRPEYSKVITGVCDYGVEFAASVKSDNIFAVQYHPEKSQKVGLKVLQNLLKKIYSDYA
jgi:glutamine amidotransferase